MDVRADLDLILHFDLPAACPSFSLNATMVQRYTRAQAAGKRAVGVALTTVGEKAAERSIGKEHLAREAPQGYRILAHTVLASREE
jgi:hypothetical protein